MCGCASYRFIYTLFDIAKDQDRRKISQTSGGQS